MTDGFAAAVEDASSASLLKISPKSKCVLVTGATGSLRSHFIANLAHLPNMTHVVSLNQRSKHNPKEHQQQILIKKGIFLPKEGADKLKVFETDLSKP